MCNPQQYRYTCGHTEKRPLAKRCVYQLDLFLVDPLVPKTDHEYEEIRELSRSCRESSKVEVKDKKEKCPKCRSKEASKNPKKTVESWEKRASRGLLF